ncbi:hypothetical protein HRD49_38695 [Corallococcus exiguus]|uniref:hypothetical protein n=1 Tax=Corallococcus exiguus TaxID=83462 RepID=UPI0015612410|nr:hypothetical protein [Corallococcus exiguus]NRD67678.1 hypothetical protein [Corallococcus exiguus]
MTEWFRQFIGVRLTVSIPRPTPLLPGWERQVRKAAESNGLDLLDATSSEDRLMLRLFDRGSRSTVGPRTRDFAQATMDALSIPAKNRSLAELSVMSPRVLLQKGATWFAIALPVTGLIYGIWRLLLWTFYWWLATRSIERSLVVIAPFVFAGLVVAAAYLSDSANDIERPFQRAFGDKTNPSTSRRRLSDGTYLHSDGRIIRHDSAGHLLEVASKSSDPNTDPSLLSASTEVPFGITEDYPEPEQIVQLDASAKLRSRTTSIRDDRDLLWVRAQRAFQLACFFLFLSTGGPGVAVWLLVTSRDWHYLLASISLAAVPLAIGLALLRHDNKLREQHRDAESELAALDRLQLALDYAQGDTKDTQRETLRKVIGQLLRPSKPASRPESRRPSKTSEKDADDGSIVGNVFEKAADSVAAVLKKGD